MAYTVFTSYLLESTDGYSSAIHCNYIKTIPLDTDTPDIMQVNMNFQNVEDFKFLSTNNGITGYTADRIFALIQIVSGTVGVKPLASDWKKFEIIPTGHVAGTPLTADELTAESFIIPLHDYYVDPLVFIPYNLTYLNYPTSASGDLCFGDEVYFFGNVSTEIHADVYVTDLSIRLPLNEFNSSSNITWAKVFPRPAVAITEIGIYDDNKNLVAIGKLNDPIVKDGTIARTILFALDF